MNENPSISSLKKNGKSILIDWSDGEQSKFNFLWLRDNCPSEVHPTARERTFNLLNVSENIHPKAFTINDKGQLEIEWSEGSHISHYDVEWLRHNCYTMKSKKKYSSPYFLWDNSMQSNFEDIQIDYQEIISGDEGIKKWLEQLHYKGISIVKNAPTEKESGFDVLSNIVIIEKLFLKHHLK